MIDKSIQHNMYYLHLFGTYSMLAYFFKWVILKRLVEFINLLIPKESSRLLLGSSETRRSNRQCNSALI